MEKKPTNVSLKTAGGNPTATTGRNPGLRDSLSYGSEIEGLVSRYGKKIIEYSFRREIQEAQIKPEDDKGVPPFVVVGLGRCGCHVSAELSEIIAFNDPSAKGKAHDGQRFSWMSSFFNPKNGEPPALRFEPIVLVGDIDETSFDDVGGLLQQGGVPKYVQEGFLQLKYSPLAEGGVGHVPIFAEFLTRALLLLPAPADLRGGGLVECPQISDYFQGRKEKCTQTHILYIQHRGRNRRRQCLRGNERPKLCQNSWQRRTRDVFHRHGHIAPGHYPRSAYADEYRTNHYPVSGGS